PDRCVEFEAAGDGDDFLAVGNAPRSGNARDGDTFGATEILAGELGSTARARRLRLVVLSRGWRFLAATRADIDVFAKRNLNRFKNVCVAEAESLAVGDVTNVRAELAVGPQEVADRREQVLDVIVLLDELSDIAGRARSGDIRERLRRLRVETHTRHVLRE